VIPGNPASGLLRSFKPGVGGTPGDGDLRIQAFNYRLCFTQNATNRLPHVVPPHYDPARYELLGRLIDARLAAGHTLTMSSFFNISSMPNGKTDMNNNGAFSTDYIGQNHDYPTNTYAARAQLEREAPRIHSGPHSIPRHQPALTAESSRRSPELGPTRDEWPENPRVFPPALRARGAANGE
jgi:hypothetical protein